MKKYILITLGIFIIAIAFMITRNDNVLSQFYAHYIIMPADTVETNYIRDLRGNSVTLIDTLKVKYILFLDGDTAGVGGGTKFGDGAYLMSVNGDSINFISNGGYRTNAVR